MDGPVPSGPGQQHALLKSSEPRVPGMLMRVGILLGAWGLGPGQGCSGQCWGHAARLALPTDKAAGGMVSLHSSAQRTRKTLNTTPRKYFDKINILTYNQV